MSGDLDQIRAEIAQRHGLAPGAASFLAGATTLAEAEAQAAELAALAGRQEQPVQPAASLFTPAAPKRERQRALLTAIHPPAAQPRDPAGRFATPAVQDGSEIVGFDGGRRGAALPPPAETHDQWLSRALRDRSLSVGRHFS